jgi:hypothetical protein
MITARLLLCLLLVLVVLLLVVRPGIITVTLVT